MSIQKNLGQLGEDCAAKFLEAHGYEIVARNFRIRSAEIDIIARADDVLVFAEVKARSNIRHGLPAEAVNIRKQKKNYRGGERFPTERKFCELRLSL